MDKVSSSKRKGDAEQQFHHDVGNDRHYVVRLMGMFLCLHQESTRTAGGRLELIMFSYLSSTPEITCLTSICLRSEHARMPCQKTVFSEGLIDKISLTFDPGRWKFIVAPNVCVLTDCRPVGGTVVRQPAFLSLLWEHPGSNAGQPFGSLWLFSPVPHQSFQDLLLQITLLAAQTLGKIMFTICVLYSTTVYAYTEQEYKHNTCVFAPIFHKLNSKTLDIFFVHSRPSLSNYVHKFV